MYNTPFILNLTVVLANTFPSLPKNLALNLVSFLYILTKSSAIILGLIVTVIFLEILL